VPTRRTFLLGGAAVLGAGLVGVGASIEQGVLPGRPFLQEHLGLNGEDGVIPDVEAGTIVTGSFVSEARGGVETGWSLVLPPGAEPAGLPVVVALHGLGANHTTFTAPDFGIDRFLTAYVEDGGTPFAIVAADGGTTYWHPRPSGEDASRMVTDELLPIVADRGLDTSRFGLIGWSMGGYGALRLGGLLGPERVTAVVASSPALWSDPGDASTAGFDDAAEYERESIFHNQADLTGIPVRVDIGTGDPFFRDVQDYVAGFPDAADLTSTFEPGGHTPGYWRRMLPAQLEFLGSNVQATGH
jgi:enterochelin esterase-like enzyme